MVRWVYAPVYTRKVKGLNLAAAIFHRFLARGQGKREKRKEDMENGKWKLDLNNGRHLTLIVNINQFIACGYKPLPRATQWLGNHEETHK